MTPRQKAIAGAVVVAAGVGAYYWWRRRRPDETGAVTMNRFVRTNCKCFAVTVDEQEMPIETKEVPRWMCRLAGVNFDDCPPSGSLFG